MGAAGHPGAARKQTATRMEPLTAAAHPARRGTAWPPALTGLVALLGLALGLALAGATVARPGAEYGAGDPLASRALVRFHGVEQNATDTYRWSEPLAGVFLYGFEGRPAVVELRLAAPRPAATPPAELTARVGGEWLGSFTVSGEWRRYRLLAPTRPAGETALLLETPAFVPADDPRELGVALSRLRVAPAGDGRALPLVRWLFLFTLPVIGWLLLWRLGARPGLAAAAAGLLALVAVWAAAFPTTGGYWLPTLGWPWWPVVPLLLLAAWPRLAGGLAVGRAALDRRPALGWLGLALALAAIVGMRLGLPWFAGMALLVAGVWAGLGLIGRGEPGETPELPRGTVPAVLLLVLGVALALRLLNLDGQPAGLWRDESRHGLQALQIWSDPGYRPVYVVEGADLPALLFYLMAPLVGLLGPHAWSARLVSALAGALTPLALYWAASPLLGKRAALLAAALAAWASWSLSMSRWAFPATLDHLLVLGAVGLVWRCAPAGGWRALAGMALAGHLGGLALYAYHTGRVAPLALAVVAAIRLGADRVAWRRALPGLAVAALAGALTIAPLAAAIIGDPEGYNRRVGSVSILDSNDPQTHTPVGLVLGNLGRYLLMFHVRGDANGRHHLPEAPMLDPVAGLLLALGLGLALRSWRAHPGVAVAISLGAIYLIPGVFSGNAPHAMRSLGTLAPALMLAGFACAALLRAVPGRPRWARREVLAAGALSVSLAFNGWLYFAVMAVEPRVYGEFDLLETAMGRLAAAPAASADPSLAAVRVYVPDRLRGEDTFRFLTWGLPTYGYTGAGLPPDGAVLLLLPGDARPAAQAEALAALGAGGELLGPVARYPGTERPVALAFGRGAAATRLLAESGLILP